MNSAWIITPATLMHRGEPAFSAQWRSGVENLQEIAGVFWYDAGSENEEDSIVLFGFQWAASSPDQTRFAAPINDSVSYKTPQ